MREGVREDLGSIWKWGSHERLALVTLRLRAQAVEFGTELEKGP